MFARILSFLFPPRLPGRMQDWPEPTAVRYFTEENGWAGNVKQHYRDGIQRYHAENWVDPRK